MRDAIQVNVSEETYRLIRVMAAIEGVNMGQLAAEAVGFKVQMELASNPELKKVLELPWDTHDCGENQTLP